MAAANLITPLVACLDPKMRFPIINGETGVTLRLARLGLSDKTLEEKVRGCINVIGQYGVTDAFALDTMDEDLIEKIKKSTSKTRSGTALGGDGTALKDLDDAERKALLDVRSVIYRRRHTP
jgi:hypothetical protein